MDIPCAKQSEMLSNDMFLRLSILHYLNESNHLECCLNAVVSYANALKFQKYHWPFRYVLEINFTELVEASDVLASTLLSEPHYVNYLINHLLHYKITTDTVIEINADDVIVSLRINLPPLPYVMNSTDDQPTGLFMIRGILISITALFKHLQSTVFCCPVSGCDNSDGVRIYDSRCSNLKLKCSLCDVNRVQVHSSQELIDELVGVFIEKDSLNQTIYNHSQGKKIFFRGALCEGLILGENYNVTVCYQDGCLTAWGVHRPMNNPQIRLQNDISSEPIPRSIQNLITYIRTNTPQSPWALTTALSLVLGAHLAPPECFMHLRAGILLSLASLSGESNCQPIHLLCINPDGKHILQHCSRLAARTINSGSSDNNLAGMTCSDDEPNRIWFDAGPLLLAGNGICYLGEWSKYESSNSLVALQIKQALENGEVKTRMRSGSRFGSCSTSPTYLIHCSIWAELDTKPNCFKKKEKIKMRSTIELFGMPFIGDCDWDKTVEVFTKHRLRQATIHKYDENRINMAENGFGITEDDLKKYLELISSYPVTISPKASSLLRKYFVSIRRTHPDCLPLAAIKIMTTLAEAHARVNMNQEATENDVIYIIYLYEQAITYLYGGSQFSNISSNFYTISSDSTEPYSTILEQVDNNIIKFSATVEGSLKYLANEDIPNQYAEE